VERFEVEVADPLKGRAVKRPVPGCETLELADPRGAVKAGGAWLRGLVEPGFLLGARIPLCRVCGGGGEEGQ
jgi:hypothetical protein